ncbi:glycogen debranching protein GlgX [Sphingomonas bacterium]|uniref:glycogen debranching protein GlgX n=1 Tax=Sphingomonas bacterium TaxID=1895847 RepID=UPI0015765E19|nr:glycogen debranching protein GlgX [Sphingomonas bacterium]
MRGPPPRPGAEFGAYATDHGTRFSVRSPLATNVTLCLFDGVQETRIPMTRTGETWSAMANAPPGARYGYRADGPAHCFDPSKLLVDPYATELDRRFAYDPRLSQHGADTAALVPKAIVPAPLPPIDPPQPLFTAGGLIYELNVRGFTMRHPYVPPEQRGTIRALAHPAIIAHLKKLRVAAIELMPIVAWIDERHLAPLGLTNAWGYNPVVPMAIDPGLAPGGVAELRETVAALRAAGIGVILDLVFNHTGESDASGPTLSLRGLDDASYARTPDGMLVNHTGTGNMLDFAQDHVRALTLASLLHFAAMGVDGFRFDLAPVIARSPGFDPRAPIFAEIATDPLLSTRIMIAEPWDIGPGGYQLGAFPDTWLEWNDRYRDDVRRFWRGDGDAGTLATRIAGSPDIFGGTRTRAVNFIAAHDGFTLADIVAYRHRHNDANGEDNRDGHGNNLSWNYDVEGATDDPAVLARRDADRRALLATLFASKGTIMLTAGDEFGRTQAGNNNAYAQDNAISWTDWTNRDVALEDFAAALADFRACSPMAQSGWLADADWRGLDGQAMTPDRWAGAQGFELRLPDGAETVILRIDRPQRRVTMARATILESRP